MSFVLSSPRMFKKCRVTREMQNRSQGYDVFHGKNAIRAMRIIAIQRYKSGGVDGSASGIHPAVKISHDAIIWNDLLFIY